MKVKVTEEQILILQVREEDFVLSGEVYSEIPWHLLAHVHLYAQNEEDLHEALLDAVGQGYQILEGTRTDRRGIRSFQVGIGAWGWAGRCEVRSLDTWAIEGSTSAENAQRILRATCNLLNETEFPFEPTALRWLSNLTKALVEEDDSPPLAGEVGAFCRRAHIGGPIVHARSSLEGYVKIDRSRAFGEAMRLSLPVGEPAFFEPPGTGLTRWRPHDLMRACGIAQATVKVKEGPAVPLLPVLRYHKETRRAITFHPVGTLKGHWTLEELSALERHGRGEVKKIHKVVTFEQREIYAPIIHYLRTLEKRVELPIKRLEHILYGACARGLGIHRFASTRRGTTTIGRDLLRENLARRIEADSAVRKKGLKGAPKTGHPLHEISGFLGDDPTQGLMDRPDRSAIITARNRVAMWGLIEEVDRQLGSSRPGEAIGRVYVDGMDVEVGKKKLTTPAGCVLKQSGKRLRIYRSATSVSENDNGEISIESSGFSVPEGCSEEVLKEILQSSIDLSEMGPLQGGRIWPQDGDSDARMFPGQRSEPLKVDLRMLKILGFCDTEIKATT